MTATKRNREVGTQDHNSASCLFISQAVS